MSNRIQLMGILYFILIFILALLGLKFLSKNINISEKHSKGYAKIEIPKIIIPTEEDLQKLEWAYEELTTYFEDTDTLKEEIKELYSQVEEAKVCSIANKHFNSLEEKYNELNATLSTIQIQIATYEEKCEEYLTNVETIPKYSSLYSKKLEEFEKRIGPNSRLAKKEKQKVLADNDEIDEYYTKSKQIADDFFYEYYDLMCRIVNAEAGGCTSIEQCYVANVIENRIASYIYPNTILGVIYDDGQYEPTWNGAINKIPNSRVKKNVEEYLRGRVETNMPSNVVYQATFPQGSETWTIAPSGQYFCYR